MRKPHWEEMAEIHESMRTSAKRIVIEGHGPVGPISDLAVIRRVLFLKKVTGSGLGEAAETAGKFDFDRNELVGDRCPIPGRSKDWISANSLAAMVMFARGGERIYKLGREFGEVLQRVDLDVMAGLIPEIPYFFCIEFPESVRFHDQSYGDYFHCAYVALQKASESFRPVDRHGRSIYCTLEIVLPCYTADGKLKDEENNTTLCFREKDENISSSIERAQESSTHPIRCREVFEFLMKALVYLGSGEPDLRQYRAPRPTTGNPKKLKRWHNDHANQSLVDMTLVGFSWKKPRVYTVGEVNVTGHPRWQPYGPGKAKVKLIWIDPYVRHHELN